MSKLANGGPAFPTTKPRDGWGDPNGGMSLRDWFAGQALQAILHNPQEYKGPDYYLTGIAANAYSVADAMLKERER